MSGAPMKRVAFVFGGLTLALVVLGVLVASSLPGGLESVAESLGFSERAAHTGSDSPFTNYETSFVGNSWLSQAVAGLVGVGMMCGFALLLRRSLRRRQHSTTTD